jgi:hypothetical protein
MGKLGQTLDIEAAFVLNKTESAIIVSTVALLQAGAPDKS